MQKLECTLPATVSRLRLPNVMVSVSTYTPIGRRVCECLTCPLFSHLHWTRFPASGHWQNDWEHKSTQSAPGGLRSATNTVTTNREQRFSGVMMQPERKVPSQQCNNGQIAIQTKVQGCLVKVNNTLSKMQLRSSCVISNLSPSLW